MEDWKRTGKEMKLASLKKQALTLARKIETATAKLAETNQAIIALEHELGAPEN